MVAVQPVYHMGTHCVTSEADGRSVFWTLTSNVLTMNLGKLNLTRLLLLIHNISSFHTLYEVETHD